MQDGRRSFVQWMLGGGFTASILSFIYPAIRFLDPPKTTEAAVNEVPAGKTTDLKPNAAKIVKFGSAPVLLLRLSETEWKAHSAVCTHLNCTVQYDDVKRLIWCACHNGYYDLNGQVVSGPPPKPLKEFVVNIRGEEVIISRQA